MILYLKTQPWELAHEGPAQSGATEHPVLKDVHLRAKGYDSGRGNRDGLQGRTWGREGHWEQGLRGWPTARSQALYS